MKRIITTFLVTSGLIGANAEDMTTTMQSFLQGCNAMREAIENNRLASLTDAKIALSSIRLSEFSDADYAIVNTKQESMSAPTILFTPEFASELSKKKVIEYGNLGKSAHLMRGDEYDLKLLHGTIAPKDSITFSTEAIEFCEMALFSLSDSNLSFEIKLADGSIVPMILNGDGSTYYTNWNLAEDPSSFQFTVYNYSERPQTFVIAIN
ncbi:MAG: hypothetical protein K2I44_00430 [Muribaculaceae bacterium]|nr:hypothetical protein [Muribaculaceae bacterium]